MLELNQITKSYSIGSADAVQALKGINIKFRRCDLVSILGPSGCGKSTTLNIIGGLDQYTSGDLVINGRSTKGFTDRDWDNYRNHSVGFIFQSYNLIRHQSVVDNVELALTLSGVSKKDRREKAKKALIDVGLGDHIDKTPKEMSGGQMQRVAIARALVNNPDIILADEPTGALDSKTSVQVMEILKEVAKDRLVVMVTHNPELAEQYSTRIIRMKDGEVIEDTRPLSKKEIQKEHERDLQELKAQNIVIAEEKGEAINKDNPRFKIFKNLNNTKLKTPKELIERAREKRKQPHLSHKDQFKLSLKNLFTKKGRTILTAFAGSVGIFGIGAVLAISQGMNGYITETEEKTLSTTPLTISSNATDFTAILQSVSDLIKNSSGEAIAEPPTEPEVRRKQVIGNLANLIQDVMQGKNNLAPFKTYLEDEINKDGSKLNKAIAGIYYGYNMELSCFYPDYSEDGKTIVAVHETNLFDQIITLVTNHMDFNSDIFEGIDISAVTSIMSSISSLTGGSSAISLNLWEELLTDKNDNKKLNPMILKQYELVGSQSKWPDPNKPEEIVLVCDANYEIPDITLYSLGLIQEEEMGCIMNDALNPGSHTWEDWCKEHPGESKTSWNFAELMKHEYRMIPNYNFYKKSDSSNNFVDIRNMPELLVNAYQNEAVPLKISGIVKLKNEFASSGGLIGGAIGYTQQLRDLVIDGALKSDVYKAQYQNEMDVLTGLPFKSTAGGQQRTPLVKATELEKYVDEFLYGDTPIESLVLSDEEKVSLQHYRAQMQRHYVVYNLEDQLASKSLSELWEQFYSQFKDNLLIKTLLDRLIEEFGEGKLLDRILVAALTIGGMSQEAAEGYLEGLNDEQKEKLCSQVINTAVKEIVLKHDQISDETRESEYINKFYPEYASKKVLPVDQKTEIFAIWFDKLIDFSPNTYEGNLASFGGINTKEPTTIKIYANTFNDKSNITSGIDDYNVAHPEDKDQIKYTDYVGFILSSVGKILTIITNVLVAFAAISLIVSSIMIAVITLISVQERTKEIGILRAIGASKRNVSGMFRAETVIIGVMSGILGVLLSYAVCPIANVILRNVTGAQSFTAMLAWWKALALVAVSVVLTVIAGLIPSRTAAKKDPVEALRSE